VLVGRRIKKLRAVEADINESFPEVNTIAVAADVSDTKSVNSLFAQLKSEDVQADDQPRAKQNAREVSRHGSIQSRVHKTATKAAEFSSQDRTTWFYYIIYFIS
jgi:hypothetical protein